MTRWKQGLEKQRQIDKQKEKSASLQAKLQYQERTAQEGLFRCSPLSSKIPVKPKGSGWSPRLWRRLLCGAEGATEQWSKAEQMS